VRVSVSYALIKEIFVCQDAKVPLKEYAQIRKSTSEI